jgi:hypothetical protein
LRKTVDKSSNILLTFGGIGILVMILGFLYFSGAGGVEGALFYGYNFTILLAFGFYLSLIGFFPVLTSLDGGSKNTVRKFYPHLIILTVIGVILVIYSALIPHTLAPLDPNHTWFDYYIFGALLFIFGLSPILLAVRDRERIWKFKILLLLVFLVGILLEIASLLIYFEVFEVIDIEKSMWLPFFLYGSIILFLGMIPLFVGASSSFRNIIHKLRLIWILIAVIGIVVYIIPTIALNFTLPVDVFEYMGYFEYLIFGGLITAFALLLISASDRAFDFIHKLRYFLLLILLLGTIQLILSFILVLPTSEFVEISLLESIPLMTISTFPSTSGWPMFAGMTWDVLFVNGIMMTLISIIFICSILFFESEEISVDVGALMTLEDDKLPGIDTTPSEMLTYLEIINKSQVDMLKYFKKAARQDKFRPRVFEALTKQYKDLNKIIQGRITDYRKKAPISAKGLFDAALAESAAVPVKEPTTPSVAEVTPTPSVPPIVPPSIPTAPPPIPSTAPPPPSPSPPMPATVPPSTPTAPTPGDQSPLDLIADARSTSIAELRGEMLKELRRLREIFKEE